MLCDRDHYACWTTRNPISVPMPCCVDVSSRPLVLFRSRLTPTLAVNGSCGPGLTENGKQVSARCMSRMAIQLRPGGSGKRLSAGGREYQAVVISGWNPATVRRVRRPSLAVQLFTLAVDVVAYTIAATAQQPPQHSR
jgi:hypothetical protein